MLLTEERSRIGPARNNYLRASYLRLGRACLCVCEQEQKRLLSNLSFKGFCVCDTMVVGLCLAQYDVSSAAHICV